MTLAKVGIIGVGMMGAGLAGRLISAGYPVTLMAHSNRRAIETLLAQGAQEATSGEALARKCDVLLTCVPNAHVVETIAEDVGVHLAAGKLWIDVTTSRPETSKKLAAQLAKRGVRFADAPVTGGPQEAADGRLASLVGCDQEDFARVEAIVGCYSKTIRRFGAPGTGHAAKLLNNLVTQGTLLLLADAYHCAARVGVDAEALYDIMMSGAARSGSLEKAVKPALAGDFSGARFSIANAAKDLRYARDLLGSCDADREPLAALLAERLDHFVRHGRGDDYVSKMFDTDQI